VPNSEERFQQCLHPLGYESARLAFAVALTIPKASRHDQRTLRESQTAEKPRIPAIPARLA